MSVWTRRGRGERRERGRRTCDLHAQLEALRVLDELLERRREACEDMVVRQQSLTVEAGAQREKDARDILATWTSRIVSASQTWTSAALPGPPVPPSLGMYGSHSRSAGERASERASVGVQRRARGDERREREGRTEAERPADREKERRVSKSERATEKVKTASKGEREGRGRTPRASAAPSRPPSRPSCTPSSASRPRRRPPRQATS